MQNSGACFPSVEGQKCAGWAGCARECCMLFAADSLQELDPPACKPVLWIFRVLHLRQETLSGGSVGLPARTNAVTGEAAA